MKKHEDLGIKHVNNPNAFIEVQMLWMMFMRIFMITIQTEKKNFNCF